MKRISLIACRLLFCVTLLPLAASCTDELFGEGYGVSSGDDADGMGFSMSTVEQADLLYNLGRTRAAMGQPLPDSATIQACTPMVTPFQGGLDQPLYLHRQSLPLVGIHPRAVGAADNATPQADDATRASTSAIVDKGSNPLNFHDSLSLWGCVYNPDETYQEEGQTTSYHRFLFKQTLLKKIRGWRSSVHWPYDDGKGKYMRFCAMAPAFESLEQMKLLSDPVYNHNGGNPSLTPPTFSYQVPSDPARQVDLLFGSSGDTPIDVMASPTGDENYPFADTERQRNLGEDDKIIPLTFHHILTAIRFAQGKMPTDVTINKIELHNVYNQGTYIAGEDRWSVTTEGLDASGKDDYALNTLFNVKTHNPSYAAVADNEAWKGAENIYIDNQQVLFLLPQTLPSEAQLIITLHNDTKNTDHVLSASIGNTEWPLGYTITYQVNISELYDDYYLYIDPTEAEGNATHEHSEKSNVQGSFKIHSYKNYLDVLRNTDGSYASVPYAATWQVTGFAQSNALGTVPTDYAGTSRPSWLTAITGWDAQEGGGSSARVTASGTGRDQTVTYTLLRMDENPTYEADHADILRNNPYANYRLEQYVPDATQTGGHSSEEKIESANCYIINAGGSYSFPTVYGNSYGKTESDQFNPGGIFVDHEGNSITKSNILDQVTHTTTVNGSSETVRTTTGYSVFYKDYSDGGQINNDYSDGGQIKTEDDYGDFVKAVWVWNDVGRTDVFGAPTLNSVEGRISFSVEESIVNPENSHLTPCNAVIALIGRKSTYVTTTPSGGENPTSSTWTVSENYDTLWTWHIWVTDEVYPNMGKDTYKEVKKDDGYSQVVVASDEAYISYNNGTKIASLSDGTKNYQIMPVNLGWVPDDTKWRKYEPREVWVEIEQTDAKRDGSKNKVHFKIRQEAYQDLITGTSPLYQWGRPTALPMMQKVSSSSNKNIVNPIYDSNGKCINDLADINNYSFFRETMAPNHADEALKTAISHPKALVRKGFNTGNMVNNDSFNPAFWGDGTLAGKTIYDPCPPGFCVPASAVFEVFRLTDTADGKNALHPETVGDKVTTVDDFVDKNTLNMWPNVKNDNGDICKSGDQKKGGYFYTTAHTYKASEKDTGVGEHTSNPWGIPAADRYSPLVYIPSTGKLAIRTLQTADGKGSASDTGTDATAPYMRHDTFSTGYYWSCDGAHADNVTDSKTNGTNFSTSVTIRAQYNLNGEVFGINSNDDNNGNGCAIRPKK